MQSTAHVKQPGKVGIQTILNRLTIMAGRNCGANFRNLKRQTIWCLQYQQQKVLIVCFKQKLKISEDAICVTWRHGVHECLRSPKAQMIGYPYDLKF